MAYDAGKKSRLALVDYPNAGTGIGREHGQFSVSSKTRVAATAAVRDPFDCKSHL